MKVRPSLVLSSLASVFALTLFASACGSPQDTKPALTGANLDPDQVKYDLKIRVDSAKLTDAEKGLVERINAGDTVSFKMVTSLAQQAQEREFAESEGFSGEEDHVARETSIARERLAAIVPADLATLDPAAIKLGLEDGLLGYFGKELEYEAEFANVLNPLLDNTLQCYSGTVLYNLVSRSLPGSAYRAKNFVTIFTKGHVLPGYMATENGEFVLYGIEMTQSGRAQVRYGSAKGLRGEIAVVDADYFMLTEIFKDRINNYCEVQTEIVELTAKKYGMEILKGRCEGSGSRNVLLPGVRAAEAKKSKKVKAPLFAFGESDAPKGRQKRAASQGITDLSHVYSIAAIQSARAVEIAKREAETPYKEYYGGDHLRDGSRWKLKLAGLRGLVTAAFDKAYESTPVEQEIMIRVRLPEEEGGDCEVRMGSGGLKHLFLPQVEGEELDLELDSQSHEAAEMKRPREIVFAILSEGGKNFGLFCKAGFDSVILPKRLRPAVQIKW